MRFKIVCICGSMRFYEEMLKQAARLTQEGCIVLMPHANKNDIAEKDNPEKTRQEAMLDAMHRAKIDMSSEVFVVDGDNDEYTHIGYSTRKEIEYALSQGKKVSYFSLLGC